MKEFRKSEEGNLTELRRMLVNFSNRREEFFSKGYLNSDGKKAMVRMIKVAAKASPYIKVKLINAYRKGDEITISRAIGAIIDYIELLLNGGG
ncbi:MAG: hypothetical protein B6U69_02585 [Thermofilum sp. ex4484_15]|nr:MAG: hypothetical protein B6U69_02585 [Thermofilum sp. ex4484_15]